MFDSGNWDERVDQLEQRVLAKEAEICRLRAEQIRDLRELDRYQIDTADGARTMGDWVSAHLDLSHQTSARLMTVARADDPQIDAALESGTWGLDRAGLLAKLRQAGASPELFSEAAERYSLGRLYGLFDRLRHISPADEQDLFEYRYTVIQPSLDESSFKFWGQLPGVDGQVVTKALSQRADSFPVLIGEGHGQRIADALTTICLDSLTGTEEGGTDRAVTVAEVFVDANLAAESFGETGATVSSGPRVGPNALSEILCTGKIRVIVTDGHQPVAYSDLGEAIPPQIRSFVLWRDQGQCRSRDATAATASNLTTSNTASTMAPTTPTTSSPSAGTTTTSPSTNSDSESTQPVPPTAEDSSDQKQQTGRLRQIRI